MIQDAPLLLNRQVLEARLSAVPSLIPQLCSGPFQLVPFKIWEYFEGRALLRTTPRRMNEVTGLSLSSLCNPLALPHHGFHSPSLLAYPHTTSQTIKHVAQAPQTHHVLSVNTLLGTSHLDHLVFESKQAYIIVIHSLFPTSPATTDL